MKKIAAITIVLIGIIYCLVNVRTAYCKQELRVDKTKKPPIVVISDQALHNGSLKYLGIKEIKDDKGIVTGISVNIEISTNASKQK